MLKVWGFDMSIEKLINGGWCISTMIKGYRVKRIYIGYSKKEAIHEFVTEFKQPHEGLGF